MGQSQEYSPSKSVTRDNWPGGTAEDPGASKTIHCAAVAAYSHFDLGVISGSLVKDGRSGTSARGVTAVKTAWPKMVEVKAYEERVERTDRQMARVPERSP